MTRDDMGNDPDGDVEEMQHIEALASASARAAQPSREALLAIIGEAEEVTIHQHGNPHRALDAIIVRARAALAAAPAPAQGIDHDHGGGLHSHTIHVSSAEGGGLHHHDVATSR